VRVKVLFGAKSTGPDPDSDTAIADFQDLKPTRRRFDSEIRVTRTAGDRRKEGAKHIKT